jgi:hypothetical protein
MVFEMMESPSVVPRFLFVCFGIYLLLTWTEVALTLIAAAVVFMLLIAFICGISSISVNTDENTSATG